MSHSPYGKLAVMTLASFVAMYVLMYAMVDVFANVFNNLNQGYMAGLMAVPMLLIELGIMKEMYPDRRLNAVLAVTGLVALVGFFALIRAQVAISDRQFVRSMIPHHAGAILMCERAPLDDEGLRQLCSKIIASQRAEIDEMKAKLAELSR